MVELTYVSLFSGIEAFSVAASRIEDVKWKPVFFSEIDPFPCAVLQHRFPDVPNLGDICKIRVDGNTVTNGNRTVRLPEGGIDILAGGSPCFVAGTMVLTSKGYVPIETLKVGDEVVTHRGRLRKVVRVGGRIAETAEVRAVSRPPMRCTLDHKFWSATKKHHSHDNHLVIDECGFLEIENNVGGYVAQQRTYDIPMTDDLPTVKGLSIEEIMEIAGRYCGDKAQICNTKLAVWLERHFGKLAHGKTIPAWLIAAPQNVRDAFIRGYLATDGCTLSSGEMSFTTVSKSLAYGIADVLRNACVYLCDVPPKTEIQGREVNQRPFYIVRKNPRSNRFHAHEDWTFVRVKSLAEKKTERVYQIEVEEDHSYVSDGIVSKNCQDVSIAGKRSGMEAGSGTRSSLAFEYTRLVKELSPKILLWENVPGAVSSNRGLDFLAFVRSLVECGYTDISYRVLDAQYVCVDGSSYAHAIPQRRKRIWLVGVRSERHFGAGIPASAQVLFESQSNLGINPPCRKAGQKFACPPGYCTTGNVGMVENPTGAKVAESEKVITETHERANCEVGGNGERVDGRGTGQSPVIDKGSEEAGNNPTIAAECNNQLQTSLAFAQNQREEVRDLDNSAGTLSASEGTHQRTLVATFAKVDHAINPKGDGEKYAQTDVVQTFNTFQNSSDSKAIELAVMPSPDAIGIYQQGGKGTAAYSVGVAPTMASDSHGTPHAVAVTPNADNSLPFNTAVVVENDHCCLSNVARTITGDHESRVTDSGMSVIMSIGFKAGQSANGGLGEELEVAPTMSHQPSALEPTVAVWFSHSNSDISIQTKPTPECGMTIRSAMTGTEGNDADPKVCYPVGKQEKTSLSTIMSLDEIRKRIVDICDKLTEWPEDDWCEVVPGISLNIYLDMDGKRKATAFQDDDENLEFGVDIEYVGDGGEKGNNKVQEAKNANIVETNSTEVQPTRPFNLRYIVRRLTPVEAERLQGFPDNWTRIPYRGKTAEECPDSPRYKGLGNSMATNCVEWVVRRIVAAIRLGLI